MCQGGGGAGISTVLERSGPRGVRGGWNSRHGEADDD